MLLSRRLVAAILLIAATVSAHAQTARTTVSFILVNDIYQMSAQIMADGRSRGGFAKLAAVVKAERAKGGHVVFAHAGDTLSPSLTSGLDRGAHIISLTNMIAPDIFVPGNHEFDFGKAVFFQRMGEARFPLFAANLRGPDGAPLPGFKDRAILTLDGVRIGLTGATYDGTARVSSPEDLKFAPTVDSVRAETEALRGEGADFVVAVVHADRSRPTSSGRPAAASRPSRSAARRSRTARCTGSRPTISLPAAATAMSRCAMPNVCCPTTTRRCSPIRSWSTCGRWGRCGRVWRGESACRERPACDRGGGRHQRTGATTTYQGPAHPWGAGPCFSAR
jgi:hypothetical protein